MAKFIEKFLVESLVKFSYVHVWYGWLASCGCVCNSCENIKIRITVSVQVELEATIQAIKLNNLPVKHTQ